MIRDTIEQMKLVESLSGFNPLFPNRVYKHDLMKANWMHEPISIDFQKKFNYIE